MDVQVPDFLREFLPAIQKVATRAAPRQRQVDRLGHDREDYVVMGMIDAARARAHYEKTFEATNPEAVNAYVYRTLWYRLRNTRKQLGRMKRQGEVVSYDEDDLRGAIPDPEELCRMRSVLDVLRKRLLPKDLATLELLLEAGGDVAKAYANLKGRQTSYRNFQYEVGRLRERARRVLGV